MTSRGLKAILTLQGLCLFLLAGVTAWWGRLLLLQADRIHALEPGTFPHRTIRMVLWEGGALLLIFVFLAAVSIWFLIRDLRRSRQLEGLFASFTHELKTPLTSIRLQAETLAETLPEAAARTNLVTRLLEDTARLETQVDRSLELARVAGGAALSLEPVPLKPQLENILSSWSQMAYGRIAVHSDVKANWILADISALRTIFRNLLENSIKHALNHADTDRLEVSLKTLPPPRPGIVRIEYQDNGRNFSAEPKHLGTLFHKGHTSMGTGVGLFLVKTLSHRMGGRVQFSPGPEGFRVVLDFQEASGG